TITGMGGRILAQAVQGPGKDRLDEAQNATVAGTQIPDEEITSRLISLYNGATPRLMTGIAQRESGYAQFSPSNLFGKSDLWPLESFDGGSHIGLMMMEVTMQNAFDWYANTQGGVALFRQKLVIARRLMTKIQNSHPGLRALSDVELENMALV